MSVASPLDPTLWYKSMYGILHVCRAYDMSRYETKILCICLKVFLQRCFAFLNCLFVLFVLLTICIAFDVCVGIPQLI